VGHVLHASRLSSHRPGAQGPADGVALLPAYAWGKCSICERRSSRPVPAGALLPSKTAAGVAARSRPLLPEQLLLESDPSDAESGPSDALQPAGAARGGGALGDNASGRRLRAIDPTHADVFVAPFVHSVGNSWHSWDSELWLGVYCRLDLLTAISVGLAALLLARSSRTQAAALALAALCIAWTQSTMGLPLFETLVARPWIWLIMS